MLKQGKMLETIYETDENLILNDDDDDDSLKSNEQPSRLSYYICLCMIIGCFLTLGLIIAISLNPFLLHKNPINQNTKIIPINSEERLTIVKNLIKHLNIFSHQINEQLDLQPNIIKFYISSISKFSLENENEKDILWIYSDLKYPLFCINDIQCRENLNLKLKISFTKLSNFLSTIQFHSYLNQQIQLNWCNLIENSTRTILVSLVSITTINQSSIELNKQPVDRIICETVDPNILLLKLMQHDNQKFTNQIDFDSYHFENNDEITLISLNPFNTEKIQNCPNDINTQILFM